MGATVTVTYLLDANVISYFLQASRDQELSAAARTSPMCVVGEVRDELAADPKRGGASFRKWFGGSGIMVHELTVGSPAGMSLLHLAGSASTSKNLGERASIALALSDPTLTFVTHDRNAAWLALRELWARGERLLGVAPFLRQLVETGSLPDVTAADDVIAYVEPKPTWWGTWRSTLTPPQGLGPP